MDLALLNALLLAFAGGVFLNFMPCVFPILSLKIVALVKQKELGSKSALQDCMFYTLGALSSVLVLAVILLLFRTTGHLLGWGFQLQSPILVAVLVSVTFLVGLSFSGWYEIPSSVPIFGYKGSKNVESFFAGVLSSLIGTPCAAPFMVSAISFSVLQPGLYSVLVFLFMGLGMTFPYLVFSCVPGALTIMPKPGPWMEHLKQLLAFPMYMTSAWLLHVFVSQQGISSMFHMVCSVVLLVFLIWVLKLIVRAGIINEVTALILTCVFMVGSAFYVGQSHENLKVVEMQETKIVEFSTEKLQELLSRGETIFVAVGAEWCLTCKTNELIIDSSNIKEIFRSRGITYIKADWTNMDQEIAAYLNSMGASSVPFYAFYVRGKLITEPIPQLFSEGKLADILRKNLDS